MKIRKDLVLVTLDKYRISRRDDMNLVVEVQNKKKWESLGFYGYFPQALNAVVKLLVNDASKEFNCPELFGEGFEVDFRDELPMTYIEDVSEKLDASQETSKGTPKKMLNVQGELD